MQLKPKEWVQMLQEQIGPKATRGFVWVLVISIPLALGAFIFNQIFGPVSSWGPDSEIERVAQENDINRKTYSLTSEQWAKFIEAAKVPTGETREILMTYNLSCDKCFRLAHAAAERLMMLPGWTLAGGGTAGDMGDPVQGINVRVYSKQPAPESAIAIAQAFQAAGLSVSIVEYVGLRKGAKPHVYIGAEPE